MGEPLYMLFRGIKHQVDKGPVDSVTGKAKYTLNDNRLLREDVEYRPLVRVCSGQVYVCLVYTISFHWLLVSVAGCRFYLTSAACCRGFLFIYYSRNAWPHMG